MMKFAVRSLGIVAITLAVAGCSDSGNPTDTSQNSAPLLPMSVGNQWVYNVQEYDTTGKASPPKSSVLAVTSDTMIQGERWFFLNDNHDSPDISRSSGIYTWDKATNTAHQLVATPATVGSSFEKGSQRFTVTSTQATVDVLAGSFKTVQVSLTDSNLPGLTSILSLSPGVGLVKLESSYKRSNGQSVVISRWELASYTLK